MSNIYTAKVTRLLCTVAMTLVVAQANAQLPLVSSGLADHPLLARFPDSEIVEAQFREDVIHTLVLGSLQRKREEVVPEASERIRGNVTQLLYEVSQEFTGDDVYQFFLQQMRDKSYQSLFSCEGRACGSSNYWANDIFKNRILYGPERNQYYMAMRTNLGVENEPSISLYIITRANRRIYAYVEVIETGGELPPINVIETNAVLSLLQEAGSVVLPGISFGSDDRITADSDVNYLVELLLADPTLRVYLVGHLQGDEAFPLLQQRSLQRAATLKQLLIDRGVEAARIDAQGVGPLVPTCAVSYCSERIEMVLQ